MEVPQHSARGKSPALMGSGAKDPEAKYTNVYSIYKQSAAD